MFGSLGNLGSLLKQAQQIGGRLEGLTEQLKSQRATGVADGVEIEVNGVPEVVACRITADAYQQFDREHVENLIRTATNQALAKSRQLHAEAMRSLAGGLEIPGLEAAMAKLTGGERPES